MPSSYTKLFATPRVLYEAHALLNAASENSGYLKLGKDKLVIVKTHTTGTYTFTIDWSLDGTNSAIAETVSLTNVTPVEKVVIAPYAKFTVTASVAQFTVHQTIVSQ